MEIKKKVYNTPELVEHGDFIEMTQDGHCGEGDAFGSPLCQAPIPL